MAVTCRICGNRVGETDRFVLANGTVLRVHCSEPCLRASVQELRARQRTVRRRLQATALLIGAGLFAAAFGWHLKQAPVPRSIVCGPQAPADETAAPGPKPFGPPWPPTDADWLAEFAQARWIYPLPGPVRRTPVSDSRMFGIEKPGDRPAQCRQQGVCGVDLGGDLWGEHVYAVHDGVVERVRRGSNEDHGGLYVRLSHWGAMVFTQYFHLAAIPRGLAPGVRVKAGDVIGLVGDTGVKDGRMHLLFTLSIRPSSEYPEVYWDPKPLLAEWPVRIPAHGSVAGLVSMAAPGAPPEGPPLARKHTRARARKKAAAAPETTESGPASAPD